jgi:hypothetical protein
MLQAGSIFQSQVIIRVISKKSDAVTRAHSKSLRKKTEAPQCISDEVLLECDAFSHRFHLHDASTICAAIAGRAAASGSVRPE